MVEVQNVPHGVVHSRCLCSFCQRCVSISDVLQASERKLSSFRLGLVLLWQVSKSVSHSKMRIRTEAGGIIWRSQSAVIWISVVAGREGRKLKGSR